MKSASEAALHYFKKAARLMDVGQRIEALLATPVRELKVHLSIELDSGELSTFAGYRVQHNAVRGPTLGGLRYHPQVTLEDCAGLASLMTWQGAVVNLPFGGAMGGVAFDPTSLSSKELERLTRKYVELLADALGPDRDVLAPDVNTHPQVMSWAMDEFSRRHGYCPAIATGKPLELQGLRGREAATGRGIVVVCREILRDLALPLKGLRFAVQGFGNVGTHAARLLTEEGAIVVAVSDVGGGVRNPAGLNVAALFEHVKQAGTVRGFSEGTPCSNEEVLTADCEVLVPAALGGNLTRVLASEVRARVVIEGAYGPTDPEADEILEKRGVLVVPDLLANAGGAVASHYEWVQNRQALSWEEERLNHELERVLKEAYARVTQIAKNKKVPLRTAAFVLAIGRVGRATVLRGI